MIQNLHAIPRFYVSFTNNAGTRDYELSSKVKAHMLISKEIILIKMISYRFEISVV